MNFPHQQIIVIDSIERMKSPSQIQKSISSERANRQSDRLTAQHYSGHSPDSPTTDEISNYPASDAIHTSDSEWLQPTHTFLPALSANANRSIFLMFRSTAKIQRDRPQWLWTHFLITNLIARALRFPWKSELSVNLSYFLSLATLFLSLVAHWIYS